MAYSSPPSFGVGKVLSDAFTVYKAAFLPIFTIFAVSGAASALLLLSLGFGNIGSFGAKAASPLAFFVVYFGSLAVHCITFGAAVFIAFRSGHGHQVSAIEGISLALKKLFPLLAVTILWGLGFAVGWMLLMVPGIWLIGVWAAILPAVMLEDRALGAFGRSRHLSKEFRWPIIGTLIVTMIIVFVLTALLAALIGGVTGVAMYDFQTDLQPDPATITPFIYGAMVFQAIIGAAINVLIVAVIASIYQRLIEIKEGGSNVGLADVFE